MARLPDPVLKEIKIEIPDDMENRKKDFYSILGEAVRKRLSKEKTVDKEN